METEEIGGPGPRWAVAPKRCLIQSKWFSYGKIVDGLLLNDICNRTIANRNAILSLLKLHLHDPFYELKLHLHDPFYKLKLYLHDPFYKLKLYLHDPFYKLKLYLHDPFYETWTLS